MQKFFLSGFDTSLKQVTQISKLANFKPWPSTSSPFLTEPLIKRNKFPKCLSILTDNLDDEKLKKLLTLPIVSIIDTKSFNKSIHNFSIQSIQNSDASHLGLLMTCPIIYSCDMIGIFFCSHVVPAIYYRISCRKVSQKGMQ